MASMKNVLMGALALLVSTVGFAQTDFGWDWRDSSKVAVKNQPQRNEFINNVYPYPAKPRSQWELGFGLGIATMSADVKSKAGFGTQPHDGNIFCRIITAGAAYPLRIG